MPVQAPNPLEHEIDRGDVGDEKIEVEVQALLDNLGRYKDCTAWALRRRGLPILRQAEPLASRAILLRIASVEQTEFRVPGDRAGRSGLKERRVEALCAVHRVADHRYASAIAKPLGEEPLEPLAQGAVAAARLGAPREAHRLLGPSRCAD